MQIYYWNDDWGFRVKKDGDNYWLGFMNEKKDDLQETRISKGIFLALKLWWARRKLKINNKYWIKEERKNR